MMLEADVQMRHNKSDTEPIMAHPPAFDSNLTLAQFLERVSKTEKGIKLDFKSIMAVEPSLKILKNVSDSKVLKIPIWLNADILKGPCFDKERTPVDAVQFIDLCTKYFPSAVLSIGWTTGNDMTDAKNMYTWENVIEMAKLVHKITQPVTFPVRAALVKRSLTQLLWLIDISSNLTLTIWSSEKDNVNAADLVELRKSVYNKKNVYYDLPKSQAEEFTKALKGKDVSTNNPQFYLERYGGMKGYAFQTCSDIIVGKTKILFTGKGGWASTIKEVKAGKSPSTVFFDLTVYFLSLGSSNIQQNITLVLGSKGLMGSDSDVKPQDGIQVVLSRGGQLTIIKPDGSKKENKGVTDPNFAYQVGFWYGPNMEGIMINLKSKTDYRKSVDIKYDGVFEADKQYVLVGVGEQKGAVLVNEISASLAMPSGSGSRPLLSNGVIVGFVAVLIAFFAVFLM